MTDDAAALSIVCSIFVDWDSVMKGAGDRKLDLNALVALLEPPWCVALDRVAIGSNPPTMALREKRYAVFQRDTKAADRLLAAHVTSKATNASRMHGECHLFLVCGNTPSSDLEDAVVYWLKKAGPVIISHWRYDRPLWTNRIVCTRKPKMELQLLDDVSSRFLAPASPTKSKKDKEEAEEDESVVTFHL